MWLRAAHSAAASGERAPLRVHTNTTRGAATVVVALRASGVAGISCRWARQRSAWERVRVMRPASCRLINLGAEPFNISSQKGHTIRVHAARPTCPNPGTPT
ncbi:hypothetical protein ACSDR0_01260 [Streptosporangium sp. G11]|uniref:hypothetical protein n=1 Tax=Streptosporangium sp. G11 TaxID=3436926 RepID=UPI003EBA9753